MRDVTLLDDVSAAAAALRETRDALAERRAALHAAILRANAEEIPLARIGRAAGLSRERVRRIVLEETAANDD